jgi:hypothetical protein
MEIDLGERFCAAVHSDDAASPQSGSRSNRAIAAELAASAASAPLPTRELEVGLLGDFEFSQRQGVDSEEAMLARFNIVDGIFSTQANLRITPALVHVFTTSNDPCTEGDLRRRADGARQLPPHTSRTQRTGPHAHC